MTGYVYRLFNAVGDKLYVGCTVSPLRRLREHSYSKPWWGQVDAVEWEPMPHDQARARERDEIRSDPGLHNIQIPIEVVQTTWGCRLKELRLTEGLTREGLAFRAGVSVRTIARAELGEHDPSLNTLAAIAGALGVPVSDLLGEGVAS